MERKKQSPTISLLLVLAGYLLKEEFTGERRSFKMNWKLHCNALLYIIGSCLFVSGSILFHPHFSSTVSLYKTGVLMFTFGSALFCLASLQQLLGNFRTITPTSDTLLDESNQFAMDLAVSFCRDTIGSISGLLFTVGSVAFWPSYDHGGALVGNWLYRCGASLGVVSSTWSLIRQQQASSTVSVLKLMSFMSLLGSIGFLIGGGFFLYGGKHDVQGSFAWLSGSLAFLASSLFIYKL